MADIINKWAGVQEVSWTSVLENTLTFGSHYKIVPTEGYIAWEYNPLRNYRLSQNMYEKDGKYYTKAQVYKTLNISKQDEDSYLKDKKLLQKTQPKDSEGEEVLDSIKALKARIGAFEDKFNMYTLKEAGELVDFVTNELSFNIEHPVDIVPQYSYDGSVNLIINDGLNIPRLINSRFTVTGNNTYKVIDRKGDNDTNIYDQGEQFDVDTSLFKNVNKIPKLEYYGTSSGNMKIGNYHFYFKYADADGNESDWVAESGLVSVFIGNSPKAVNTGIRDENSIKSVRFGLSNIDIGYSYVKVYYTRYSADIDSNLVVQAKRIDKNFIVNNQGTCTIFITGDEDETEVTLEEINSSFDVVQNAKTQCTAANRLFMANVHKQKIEYDMLSKLSLCFCPYKHEEDYPLINEGMDQNYNISSISDGYYDTQYIYDKTGYWPEELYRIGIVYILKDGSLSPVFNIRGATGISIYTGDYYKVEQDFKPVDTETPTLADVLQAIEYSEEDFMIVGGSAPNENAKGVIQLNGIPGIDKKFPILGIDIRAHKEVIKELKKYAKGFFFVRQKRIPLTMCQGMVIGLDKESRTPTLPTIGGVISNVEFLNTFIDTNDINDINYISEGFLGRYVWSLKKKSSGFWGKVAKAIAVVAVLAAATAATVFTAGSAGALLGPGLAAAIGSLSYGTIGVAALATSITATAVIGAQSAALAVRQNRNKGQALAYKGRTQSIPKGYSRNESDDSRKLTQEVYSRYIIKDPTKNTADAIVVPDYQVNQPYYNQFLTGDDFTVKLAYEQPITNFLTDGYFISDDRHFYVDQYVSQNDNRQYKVKLVGVPDGCAIKMIGEEKFCARAGYPEEAYKYEFQGVEFDDTANKIANSDIIRGNYGSFVGMDGYQGHACDQVNIMIPGYKENNLFQYVQLRASDTSAFYAISDRIDINEINKKTSILKQAEQQEEDYQLVCYRGDSYICQYTHRINRNFNDPSAPYNDKIVDPNTWKNNYNPDKPDGYSKINLGDVNAIKLGTWLTFWLRSSYNLNIRTIDKSHVDEYLMCGNYRSFYPNYGQLASGSQKIPDSDQYNKGFTKSVSEKYYFEVPDVPYIKQEFQNRIVFSDIHVNDAYKNGFRVIRAMNHKDFPMTHGSITKLIELKNALLIVFEHGIGLVSINNQAEHPSQILSELNIISDTYGSQWKDSIIKTPSGIYGVDTVAKKIWRVKEGQIELISDMKVQEFLNQNISLTERELTPKIGIRNVKTHYNAFKHDIMFTFYDNLYGSKEKSWNLCWNEILGIFTTFYSWIPSDMENIDNIPFSFNRDTVKAISKLGIGNHKSDFADGVTLSNNVVDVHYEPKNGKYIEVTNKEFSAYFYNEFGEKEWYQFTTKGQNQIDNIVNRAGFIGFLYLDNRTLPDKKVDYTIKYSLLRDDQKNYELFDIKTDTVKVSCQGKEQDLTVSYLSYKNPSRAYELLSELYYRNGTNNAYPDSESNKVEPEIKNQAVKLINSSILNKFVLAKFIKKYGKQQKVGVYVDGNIKDLNASLGDIEEQASNWSDLKNEGDTDYTAKFDKYLVSNIYLIDIVDIANIYIDKPIFKNRAGKRLMLPKELQVNPDKIVRYLNIKAEIIIPTNSSDYKSAYYGSFVDKDSVMISAGYFESQVAITTKFNLSLLSTDFWKHGQAGIIDITDKIFPTNWYGQQHPFEFECVVVDDPSVHKIFTNLEIVSNKVKPESFHYEVVGDVYDFADDKPTMYFRQEALKALYQYNGYDIEYNPNFLEIEPKQHNRSADLPKYYSRWDSANEIYDSYKRFEASPGFNYDHLAGAEIVYYPTRHEFRVWNHVQAIDADSMVKDKKGMMVETSILKANCRYLEDKWLVQINPIIVTYKNEFNKEVAAKEGKSMFSKEDLEVYKYSSWVKAHKNSNYTTLPPINIQGTKLEEDTLRKGSVIEFPSGDNGKDNALYELYDLDLWNRGDWRPIDPTKNKERRETDVRGKFVKVRIRYSGEELAIIDFLNTIYQISFA